jgi:Zn-dependent protease with chaperone function
MKNFFEHQEQAKRHSLLLLVLFFAGLLSLSALFIVIGRLCWLLLNHFAIINWQSGFWHWYLVSQLALLGVLIGFAILKYATFCRGGQVIAQRLGGRYVAFNTTMPAERQLRNIMEEMALAAGIRIPSLYILDDEPGINAFAAGMDPEHAVIAVTAGALRYLNREELQAIIAHEYSHIVQNDIRRNQQLAALISSLVWMKEIGEWLNPPRRDSMLGGMRSSSRESGYAPAFGLLLTCLGTVGTFWGRLMKAALNRQREYLADAAAVQFTRYDMALANALKKVGGHQYASLIFHPQAESFAHLFFCQGLSGQFHGYQASHPPLSDRIQLLDPTWDGYYITPKEQVWPEGSETGEQPVQALQAQSPAAESVQSNH